jgi:hypothetical protein
MVTPASRAINKTISFLKIFNAGFAAAHTRLKFFIASSAIFLKESAFEPSNTLLGISVKFPDCWIR